MEEGSTPQSQEPAPPTRVGIRELRHDFRAWLDRVRAGERVVITDRGRPIVDLVQHVERPSRLQELRDLGMVIPATRPVADLPPPVRIGGEITTIVSDALRHDRDGQRF